MYDLFLFSDLFKFVSITLSVFVLHLQMSSFTIYLFLYVCITRKIVQ
jgi:hypothetical protein